MGDTMMTWDTPLAEAPLLPVKNAAGNKIAYSFEVAQFKRNPKRKFGKNSATGEFEALSVDIKLNVEADVDGEHHGDTLEDMLVLSVKMQFKIFQYFTAIGVREKGSGNFDPVKAKAWEPGTNVGMTGKCYLKVDEFNGQKRIKIDRYLEPDDSGVDV